MKIKTFGSIDQRSLDQLKRCMEAGDAELGVLCADHHPGYSQPIGGGIAYEGYVSPSGVGYDIGCIAAGERVTTVEGYSQPIELIAAEHRVACLDRGLLRAVDPHFGSIARGARRTIRLVLANGREPVVTPDHEVLTPNGWRAAASLTESDSVLCQPYVGLAHEPYDLPAALVRLLGYASGDGHLSRDGKTTSIYTTVEADAVDLAADFAALAYHPRIHRRERGSGRRREILVKVGSCDLNDQLTELGSPAGPKRWARSRPSWLLDAPRWVRALFLSAFASAEMTTPRVLDGRIVNLALKQADPNAASFVADLLASLGFTCSVRPIGGQWVVRILGREASQLAFFEEVGFCRAVEKRIAAAEAANVAWQRRVALEWHETARVAVGAGSMPLRFSPGKQADLAATSAGEGVWVPVAGLDDAGVRDVYDIVTGDPAESFLAEGVVVHNCGNKAARTDLTRTDLDRLGGVESVMGEITRRISFGMGVSAREQVDHPVLDKIFRADFRPQRKLHQLARSQLGTVGAGNHYVNLMEDEEGKVWVAVHFGSRGFGHRTASGFLALAQGLAFDAKAREGEMDSPPVLFPADSELGQSYVAAMDLALEYAYAGRDVVVTKVLEILGAEATHEVHNNHNYAAREEHFGRTYWVVRKGCTPARPGQEGFVGGSMADESVVLEGVDSQENEEALFSTVHGAGRVMSRSQAAGRFRRRRVVRDGRKVVVEEQVKPGAVDWPRVQSRLREQGIVLVGGGADEAPEVYKRLPDVLDAHAGTIRVKHRMRPLGVAMAGRDVYDPYKD